jgi:membrane protein implicated in regulation of membrane protease activity
VAIAWVVLGVVLVAIELHHLAFYALFGALAAFAAALVAVLAPDAIIAQAVVAVGVTAAGIVAVRPFVSRAFHRHQRGAHVALGVHGGLVGQEVLTLDEVGDPQRPGHVRLAGERWLAVTGGEPLAPGTTVIVTDVRGTTLVVYAVDWANPAVPTLPERGATPELGDRATGEARGATPGGTSRPDRAEEGT